MICGQRQFSTGATTVRIEHSDKEPDHLAENRQGYADSEGGTDKTIKWRARVEAAERKMKEAIRKEE